jgi:F-type H+-transporting ATPase subunit delta
MKSNSQLKREAKQLFRLCLSNGRPDDQLTRSVAHQIATNGHRGDRAILKHFGRLVRLREAQRTAVIESAQTLPAELQDSLAKGLARRYGPGLTFTFMEQPALIAGIRIQIGSDVFDGSVRGRLIALERNF